MLPKEYFAFFKGLEKNNTREWFNDHKPQFEKDVKAPFKELVTKLIEKIQKVEPELNQDPKDAMFKIHRDVRFSKDKSPFKTHLGANISKYGRKSIGKPGFYFEVGAKGGGVAGGCYDPDKDQLTNIRDLIMHEGKEFRKLIGAKSFASLYGELQGEKNKVVPAEFKAAALNEPYILNKQLYWWAELPVSVFLDKNCVNTLMKYHAASQPLSKFLLTALD